MRSGLVNLGEKAVESAGERITDLTGRLNDFADGGGVLGSAAKKGGKEAAEGESPVKGALMGGLTGVKDKVKDEVGGGSSGGGEGDQGHEHHRGDRRRACRCRSPTTSGPQFDDVLRLHEEGRVGRAAGRDQGQLQGAGLLVPPQLGGDDPRAGARRADRLAVQGRRRVTSTAPSPSTSSAPNLTRILVVLEYYPQGLFERTATSGAPRAAVLASSSSTSVVT